MPPWANSTIFVASFVSLTDGAWVAIGGVATAFVTATFAFAGVIVSTARQKEPRRVTTDDDPLAACRAALREMTFDRDRWREIAMSHIVGRRRDDPKKSNWDDGPSPDNGANLGP